MNELEQLNKAANAILNKDIQYYHDRLYERTYAVDVNFNKEDLLECSHQFDNPITISIGISYVHPKDIYSKAIGRLTSATRLTPTDFKFFKLVNSGDHSFIYLESKEEEIQLVFRVNKKSDKPHFIRVN